jgi:hyperosmotically inducible periplasmic protein
MSARTLLCVAAATTLGLAALVPLSQQPPSSLLSDAYAQTPAQNAEDQAITGRIRAAIEADPEVNMFSIRIETLLGEVRIVGAVNTQKQAERIIYHARMAGGVRQVKDELTVRTTQ